MLSTKLLVTVVLSTSMLFLTAVSPFFLFESVGQWPGSWQKHMFSTLCHQDPARTLQINGVPAAVCGRCLGIYAFLSLGFIFVPILKQFFIKNFQYSKALLIFAVLVLLADFGMQWLNIYEGTNITRFYTGSLLGLSTTIFLIYKG